MCSVSVVCCGGVMIGTVVVVVCVVVDDVDVGIGVGIDCVMEGDDDGTCCDGVCVLDGTDGIVVDLVGVDVIVVW